MSRPIIYVSVWEGLSSIFLQRYSKCAPVTRPAFNIQRTFMLLNDLASDGKAEAKPAVKLVPTFFEVIEAVKDARPDLGVDADAMIFHGNIDAVLVLIQTDLHIAAR